MNERRLTQVDVEAWLLAVRSDLDQLDGKLKPLVEEQQRLQAREALLIDLLSSFGPPAATAPSAGTVPIRSSSRNGSTGSYVVEKTMEILRDEGQPLHINDIHTKFLERGFAVPGAGKAANLIVHLRKSERIASPRRGIYGLVEQVGSSSKPPIGKKRTAKRRRRTRKGPNSGSS
jgi:hypothetical protein